MRSRFPALNGAAAEPVPRVASRAAFHAKRECCLSSNSEVREGRAALLVLRQTSSTLRALGRRGMVGVPQSKESAHAEVPH
jgi:hypothetical protein